MSEKITTYLMNDVVVVPNVEDSKKLYKLGFYGKFIGIDKVKPNQVDSVNNPLQLSLIEAIYLLEKGLIRVIDSENKRELSVDELKEIARKKFRNFDFIYRIYKELRDRGFVVKSGLKFGSLFAIYEKGPGIDHAPILVHFIEPDRDISALDITRAARLSHTVNKRFVLATWNSAENKINYVGQAFSDVF